MLHPPRLARFTITLATTLSLAACGTALHRAELAPEPDATAPAEDATHVAPATEDLPEEPPHASARTTTYDFESEDVHGEVGAVDEVLHDVSVTSTYRSGAAPPPADADRPVGLIGRKGVVVGEGGLGSRGAGLGGGGSASGLGGYGTKGTSKGKGATYSKGGSLAKGSGKPTSAASKADMKAPEPSPIDTRPLKALMTDDNRNFGDFLGFLQQQRSGAVAKDAWHDMNVSDRSLVTVTDAHGVPVPNAQVSLRLPGHGQWTATTLGNGVAPIYPHLAGEAAQGTLTVRHGDTRLERPWTLGTDAEVSLPTQMQEPSAQQPLALDVAFVLDTTGSMSDEIDRIKGTLVSVVAKLREQPRAVDLRLGGVLYRDRGDDYVTQTLSFTGDIGAFDRTMRAVTADGGGDTPEHLNAALRSSLHELDWRPHGARVAFVIADAPPHMDYDNDTPYGVSAQHAVAKGIRLHTVAASGLDDAGSLAFRQIAQLSQGRFIFIQYGSAGASAADHGIHGRQLGTNNLDQILYDRIKAEIDGWQGGLPSTVVAKAP